MLDRRWRPLGGRRSARRDDSSFVWPDGYRAAVSFTFDDARPSQLEHGLPLFERLGVSATFFVLPGEVAAQRRAWVQVVERGHEIGNHTVSHPCSASASWRSGHALRTLTLEDIHDELVKANTRIRKLLDVEPWSFAYPCGQTSIGQGLHTHSYVPLVAELFGAGRTFNDRWPNDPRQCDLAQLACVSTDGAAFERLEPYFEEALAEGGWLVLGGHELDDTEDLQTTALATLDAAVRWCRERDVWVDTVGAVGRHVTAARREAAARGTVRAPVSPG